ncbi:MAG: CDP-diacylglycerol--serine O-phosphatidyltransferase [Candidatus Hydrogenedentes bacterium]|nr:CDP-diacylglycerol--serine O-phosphatidyltransferase [Candidatus Hydrogenedentota bacterium]
MCPDEGKGTRGFDGGGPFHMNRFRREKRAQRKHRLKLRRRPVNILASLLTVMTLYCGIASAFAAITGDFRKAAYLILGAMVFDSLDGTVAKLTHTVTEFGKELDSLCDVVAFGVAPAILIFTDFIKVEQSEHTIIAKLGGVMAIVFAICGALRLARFNTFQSERRDYFTGLPIPAAGGAIATFVLFVHELEMPVAFRVLAPLTLMLAFLMVSTVRYPKDKMKALVFAPSKAFPIIVVFVFGIGIFHVLSDYSPSVALFPLAIAYVLYGIIDTFYLRVFRKQSWLAQTQVENAATGAPASTDPAAQPKTGGLL